jgi:hypothetical protein
MLAIMQQFRIFKIPAIFKKAVVLYGCETWYLISRKITEQGAMK